jgi:dTDP-glucose 4,6-dehydratase
MQTAPNEAATSQLIAENYLPAQDAEDYAGRVKPLPAVDLEHVLKHTAPLWWAARKRHLFITGGTGFFGRWLLETFAYCDRKLGLDAHATVLSRDPTDFLAGFPHVSRESSIDFLQGDVRSFEFPSGQIDFVVHAAAPTTADAAARPRELLRTIILGTERVIELAEARGATKFLLTSSGAVYGRQPEHVSHINEEYVGGPEWLDPQSAYAEGKRVAEQMCAAAAKESSIRFATARCFAFVGPHLPLDQHFAIGNFIHDALAGRTIEIRSDGTPMRSYLYAADLAIWLWTMVLRDAESDTGMTVLNVGSSEAISIKDLAQTVADEVNPSLRIEIARGPTRGQKLEQYVPDVQKAKAWLGLQPVIGLREAIRRTAAWYRETD